MVLLKALKSISTGEANYLPGEIFKMNNKDAIDCLKKGIVVQVKRDIILKVKNKEKHYASN